MVKWEQRPQDVAQLTHDVHWHDGFDPARLQLVDFGSKTVFMGIRKDDKVRLAGFQISSPMQRQMRLETPDKLGLPRSYEELDIPRMPDKTAWGGILLGNTLPSVGGERVLRQGQLLGFWLTPPMVERQVKDRTSQGGRWLVQDGRFVGNPFRSDVLSLIAADGRWLRNHQSHKTSAPLDPVWAVYRSPVSLTRIGDVPNVGW